MVEEPRLDTKPSLRYVGKVFSASKCAVLLAVCTLILSARGAEPDGPAGREAIRKEARAAFLAGDYARLHWWDVP